MCGFGSPKVDTSYQDQMMADAAEARRLEEERQGRVREGSAEIDRIFGGFDNGFFNRYRDQILNLSRPEIDRQFGDAKDELTYALARAGTLKSSMAGEKSADLFRRYDAARGDALASANSSADSMRNRVANEKSGLIALLNGTGDTERASNEALSRSQILFKAEPGYNPIGDLFGGIASGIGNYYAGRQNKNAIDTYFGDGGADRSRLVG